jgi:hypothetical protein
VHRCKAERSAAAMHTTDRCKCVRANFGSTSLASIDRGWAEF